MLQKGTLKQDLNQGVTSGQLIKQIEKEMQNDYYNWNW